ncbi:PepSY-associated TM helix domain-containing protein [Achromobacter sp. 413638]|uniref:PepSY-associated TM helix domain-containing protein n=1 Tax=Achromobacter sp. 413638 TaxID=3342385 RepID=UPI00370B379E
MSAARDVAVQAPARPRPPSRRGTYLKALRKAHGWLGLWGALLGLLFGVSGIIQNHRAVLKIDMPGPVVETLHLQAPADLPRTDADVARWLQQALRLDKPAERIRKEPARDVRWGDTVARQPERWQALFRAPGYQVQVEFWPQSGMASARRSTASWWGVIQNFHRANGAGVAWVLLSDTIGGALIALCLTGVLLWTELEKRKLIGAAVALASLATTVAAVALSWA